MAEDDRFAPVAVSFVCADLLTAAGRREAARLTADVDVVTMGACRTRGQLPHLHLTPPPHPFWEQSTACLS